MARWRVGAGGEQSSVGGGEGDGGGSRETGGGGDGVSADGDGGADRREEAVQPTEQRERGAFLVLSLLFFPPARRQEKENKPAAGPRALETTAE
jgi:hypothetical protein